MIERHGRVIACNCTERDGRDPLRIVTLRTLEGDVHEFSATADEYDLARRALALRTPLAIHIAPERA